MYFKVKRLDLKTGGPKIVVLDDLVFKKIGLALDERVKLIHSEKEYIVEVNYSRDFIKEDEIGIFADIWEETKWKDGTEIELLISDPPVAFDYVKKKMDGGRLSFQEIKAIMSAINEDKLSNIELASFITSQYIRPLSFDETVHLSRAMLEVGDKLDLKKYPIVDKHSLGGLPGNKVSMIIVPIISSLGYYMPKTSSRAITSAAGTADAMETIANVSFDKKELVDIIKKTRGCIVWGGSLNLAPTDDKIIMIEKSLSVDPEAQMIASIMAKKMSVGATHMVLDVPMGPQAKLKNITQAKRLGAKFVKVASKVNMNLKPVYTEGRYPVGNGVGPTLSARDALLVLEGKGPWRLREKAVVLAKRLLSMLGDNTDPEKVIDSGKALEQFKKIVEAQGGNPGISSDDLIPHPHEFTYTSPCDGKIAYVNNSMVIKLARLLGAPFDKRAGVYLHKMPGEDAKKEEPLFTLYARNSIKLKRAIKFVVLENPYTVKA